MIKNFFLGCLFFLSPILLIGQYVDSLGYYWVEFTEKSDTSYSLENPFEYLSQQAIERRIRQRIPIEQSDLPVNKNFVVALLDKGAQLHNTSKWFNAATIVFERERVTELEKLDFVKAVTYVGRFIIRKTHAPSKPSNDTLPLDKLLANYHGYGGPQISLINAEALHILGFRGEGIHIGVADGGFTNIDVMPFLEDIKVVDNRDFVEVDKEVKHSSTHGSKVLSLIAANIPGFFVGTSPDATFTCMKTEDTRGEYRLEECNLIAALEYADSLGIDVFNTSLGYSTFTEKTMDYTYEQMDGKTAISSQAAQFAYDKGMIVVTSAGNEGNGPWKYISVPADSPYLLTVGATDLRGNLGSFSSVGPTSDGRIKPDLAGPGASVLVPEVNGYNINFGSGTSYSSPIVAGAVACLWQAFPTKTNKEILEAIKKSCSQYEEPDNKMGHGIPDFLKAYQMLDGK